MPRRKMTLSPEQVEQVERLAAVLRMEDIADFLGISDDTLRRRMNEDPDILRAYKRGRAKANAGVGTSILQQARDGNITAMIFYAKTQMGWRETERREHVNINLDALSDEELEALADGRRPAGR